MEQYSEILSTTYWGNTVGMWALAMFGVLASLVFSKIVFKILKKVGTLLASRTKTNVDDALFDAVEEPASLFILFVGASYSLNILSFPNFLDNVVNNGIYFTFVFATAWMIDRVASCLFQEIVAPFVEKTENEMDDQLLPIVRRGVRAIVWVLAIIVGINNAGYDVGAIIAGLGIGGLAFAMAAKDTVQNLFGGLTIFMDQPFTINDRVKVEGYDGTIVEIGTRSTRLKTLEGRIVTLPNSKFTDQAVENVSSEANRKINVAIGLTYDMSADKVEEALDILKSIALNQSGIQDNPIAFFNGFGDFSLNLTFIYYIEKGEDITGIMTAVNLEIMRKFATSGLEMAFPTQTLYHLGLDNQSQVKAA